MKKFRALAALAAILFLSTVGAAQLSAPAVLPGDVAASAATGRQENPQIARGANGYLAVWADTRTALREGSPVGFNGPYDGTALGSMIDVYAARLDANGQLIDQTPIIVAEAQYNQGYPRVAWNGQNWLVVWLTEHENNRYAYDLLGARVAPDGTVLDQTPIVLKGNASAQVFPQNLIVDGAGNWLAVWEGFGAGATTRSVFVARVAPNGTVLDPDGRAVYTHTSQNLTTPDLAFAGDGYLLTFIDLSSGPSFETLVKGVRLSATLTPISAPFRINTNTYTAPKKQRVSSNGTDYFVAWSDNPGSLTSILGVRVSHTGQLLDATPLTVADNAGIGLPWLSTCWDGANWHVAYDSDYNPHTGAYTEADLFDVRVSSAGAVLDPTGIEVSVAPGAQNEVSIAPAVGGGGARLVWFDQQKELDIYAAGVSAAGTASASAPISLGAPRQTRPRMAAGGTGFLAVFRSTTADTGRILAQRLDANGNAIDTTPLVVTAGDQTVSNPSVAWNGAEFLVVWNATTSAGQQTFGRRIAADGTFIDAAPFFIMNGFTPDAAALGDAFLVANILQPSAQFRYVQAVRVSSAGTVTGTPITLQFNFNYTPRVATLGARWLVVWEYHSRHDVSTAYIHGAFVEADGTTPGWFDISVNPGGAPHLASAGDAALVAWAANSNIIGRRIQADGTLLDGTAGITITSAANLQTAPAVAWDGTEYLLDWIDQRNETYPIQPRGDIYGARVSATGVVLEEFALANSLLPEETPFVAANTSGQVVFAYAKFYDNAPYAAHRITLRPARFATPTGGSVPNAPTNLAGTRTASSASLSWTDNSTDETGFKIEARTSSTAAWTQIATVNPNVTTLTNITVGQATPYYFRVLAYNVAGDSAPSNAVAPPYASVTAPASGQTFDANTNIDVSAAASDDDGTLARVEFYARTDASAPALIGTATGAPYSITWSNVPAGTYYLSATAVDNQGQSGTSSEVSILVRTVTFDITGHVATATGAGLSGVVMTLAGQQSATTTTDANGAYSFTGLAVAGQSGYTVTPVLAGYGFNPTSRTFANASTNQTADFTALSAANGAVLISEFRLRGPNGAADEFVELYNNSDADATVTAQDSSGGWTLVGESVDGAAQGSVYVIPNGTVIPARGHFLLTNATANGGYSLTTTGDATYTLDLADNGGLALFGTTDGANFNAATRIDAVGFNQANGSNLFREGAGLAFAPTATGADEQYSFLRKLTSGTPQDTGDNAQDFVLVSNAGTVGGTSVTLGAPGPENTQSPIQRNAQLKASLVDAQAAATAAPNRVRDFTPVTNGPSGTLIIRRKFTNKTGRSVSVLRFRIVDITTAPAPVGTADLRVVDSTDVTVQLTNGTTTVVKGTTVEQPGALGGGLNSTVTIALPNGTLSPNASVSVQFALGIKQAGSFRFVVNVEASPAVVALTKAGTADKQPATTDAKP